jgi:hypothetical protein
MKLMRSFVRHGANHSHSGSDGEDLQHSMADEGAISSEFPRNPAIHGGEVEGQPVRAADGAEQARCAST